MLFNKLRINIELLVQKFDVIKSERKKDLSLLADYLIDKLSSNQSAHINVICTHNSRRSHMGQLWIMAAVSYYDLDRVFSYSGGTEATAFNPSAIEAMKTLGFEIQPETIVHDNQRYTCSWSTDDKTCTVFSKKYDHSDNPQTDFVAVLVCNEAGEACPVVLGADRRIVLPYKDPKESDGTNIEKEVYLERARQIGREMLYVMSEVVKKTELN